MSSTSPTSSVLRDRIPTVSCHNPHRINLGVDWTELLAALQEYVDQHFAPVWHTPVKIIDGKHSVRAKPGHWQLVFLRKNDQEQGIKGLLGFHDLTEHGQPLAKVFVDEVERNHEQVSVTASHELGEMLVDPWIHMGVRGPDENSWYAYETSDAVEVGPTVDVRGLPMSNFVYPEWSGRSPGRSSITEASAPSRSRSWRAGSCRSSATGSGRYGKQTGRTCRSIWTATEIGFWERGLISMGQRTPA